MPLQKIKDECWGILNLSENCSNWRYMCPILVTADILLYRHSYKDFQRRDETVVDFQSIYRQFLVDLQAISGQFTDKSRS